MESTGPFLTQSEIDNAQVLWSFKGSRRKVLRTANDLVAKLGPGLDLTEAESIKFIQRHTSIPVPRVWNSYEKDGVGYILMEYVEGELLERVWGKMDQSTRNTILLELRDYIKQMRQTKPPLLTQIGSVTGGPAIDRRTMNAIKGGPFETEKDFNEWQLKQLVEGSSQLSREMYASMHKTDHEIVFSHGDLAFHNIIVHDGHVAAIIDWEYAGWYPEHWDFCKTGSFLSGTDEEYAACKAMFEKHYLAELFMDSWFNREVQHGGF